MELVPARAVRLPVSKGQSARITREICMQYTLTFPWPLSPTGRARELHLCWDESQ